MAKMPCTKRETAARPGFYNNIPLTHIKKAQQDFMLTCPKRESKMFWSIDDYSAKCNGDMYNVVVLRAPRSN